MNAGSRPRTATHAEHVDTRMLRHVLRTPVGRVVADIEAEAAERLAYAARAFLIRSARWIDTRDREELGGKRDQLVGDRVDACEDRIEIARHHLPGLLRAVGGRATDTHARVSSQRGRHHTSSVPCQTYVDQPSAGVTYPEDTPLSRLAKAGRGVGLVAKF